MIQRTQEMLAHPDFSKDFDGAADYRFAEVCFTPLELASLTDNVATEDMARGTWCLLAFCPMETAMMTIFKRNLKDQHIIAIFSTVAAASNCLGRDLSAYFQEIE
ncbi:MAG: hypothetical protein QNL04_07595 [SAR324 cluster bacterium]|nr:hypothetical protein [SAR324 cluster bacterium]